MLKVHIHQAVQILKTMFKNILVYSSLGSCECADLSRIYT